MKLYRSKDRIWTGTQADAKAANDGDKNFEHIEVPTDKAGLIAFLNEMEGRSQDVTEPLYMTEEEVMEPSEILAAMPFEKADEPLVYERKTPLPPVVADCPACHRSKKQAKMSSTSSALINVRADLEDVHTTDAIDRIMAMVVNRRNEIVGV